MMSPKKISVFALLCLMTFPAWSSTVNFCKVKKIYGEDIRIPDETVYEDCSGEAFYWYAKDLVKATCWKGAVDLLEGKCELHNDANSDSANTENSASEDQLLKTPEESATSGNN